MSTYSGNEELRTLCQKLGFNIIFFDDPSVGPQILLRDSKLDGEVDAIIHHENLFILVGINRGLSDNVENERKKFFDRLQDCEEVADLQLKIVSKIAKRDMTSAKPKVEDAKKRLEGVNVEMQRVKGEGYEPMLRKLFFCPLKKTEGFEGRAREVTLDKDGFDYFIAVNERLDRNYLRRDFFYFLGVRKTDFEKRAPAKINEPPKSTPYRVTRVPIEQDKIIAYSLPIRVKEIQEYVTVLRLSQRYDRKGFQRMVDGDRLRRIDDNYLTKNETFPNSIIIAMNPEIYDTEEKFYTPIDSQQGRLAFLMEFNSLIMIDGQHRFFSLYIGNKTDRLVFVTFLFIKAEKLEDRYLQMYKMFYDINKNQQRIDANLSFQLKAKIEPDSQENFWYQVFQRLDKKGYFKGRYSWRETTLREEGKKSIISVIKYGGVLGLMDDRKKDRVSYPGLETARGKSETLKVDFAYNLANNYFEILEKVLYKQNVSKDRLTPREVGALFRLIRHAIFSSRTNVKILGQIEDMKSATEKDQSNAIAYFVDLLNRLPFPKLIDLKYSASSWAAVEGYMLAKIRTSLPRFGAKSLLSKGGLQSFADARSGRTP